ncbi:MAG: hypothetical protein EOM37_12965 [Proteobacteria bacterium]|nr:hypothetical protein [Pseudomonadota bacterium]
MRTMDSKQRVAEFDKGQSRDRAAEAVGMGEHYRRALMTPPQTAQVDAEWFCRAWHLEHGTRL